MMDFDQMIQTWKSQDDKPLYGVNRDLLQLVLQHEQTDIRRALRWEQGIAYIVGPGMAVFAGFWLWVSVLRDESLLVTLAAGTGVGSFAIWAGAFWLSRRRQAQRERSFDNTLQDEVRRNLSLVDYQIANGRWGAAMLWSIPLIAGALLIRWLVGEINDNGDFFINGWSIAALLGIPALCAYISSHVVKTKLEPRRQRLSELLEILNTP